MLKEILMSLGGVGVVGGTGMGIYYGMVLRNRSNSFENKGNDSKVIYGSSVTIDGRTTGGGVVYMGISDSKSNDKKINSDNIKTIQ